MTVRSLHLYPIKGCRGIDVDRIEIDGIGPVGDRRWQVVDAERRPVTQRTVPALATIEVEPLPGGLRLSAEGHGRIEVPDPGPLPADGSAEIVVAAKVAREVTAGDGGDEAAAWLTAVLDAPVRLVVMVDATDVRFPPAVDPWGQGVSFVDAAPIVIANQASLDWLTGRASEPFGMDRFRANVVIDGADPWVEDTWRTATIGAAEVRVELPWPRCAVPQVDQVTGQRTKEPALVLKEHRWCDAAPAVAEPFRSAIEGNALFAVAGAIGPVGASIGIGDELAITSHRDPVIQAPT